MSLALEGRVFVTGGAGFLARGMYRRATNDDWNAEFTCYSRDDAKHYQLNQKFPGVRCYRGDVGTEDVDRLAEMMRGHDTVIHMAATKYVDLAEYAGWATIVTNVVGSLNVAKAAIKAGVKTVVGISTDKACEPANTYGQTKAMMERLFADTAWLGKTKFVCVRYGNVVSSTGSVIPLFRKQIREQGFVTLTDPHMTRFWMTVDEAVDAIITAATNVNPGEVFVPRCRAASIRTVSWAAAELEGLAYEEKVIGVRAGEKLHEALIGDTELPRTIELPEMFGRAPVCQRGFAIQTAAVAQAYAGSCERPLTGYRSNTAQLVSQQWLIDAMDDAGRI